MPKSACPDNRAKLSFTTCRELTAVAVGQRQHFNTGPRDKASHAQAFRSLPCLQQIEVCDPPRAAKTHAPGGTRIAFWNAERCKYLAESAALLQPLAADVILLCEMDKGMARSGQRHTTRELAERLDMGYIFGVEYVELDLGDERERRWHAGVQNTEGMHGGAILSPHTLERAALLRLEQNGDWFDGSRGERRIGGRIALLASVQVGGLELIVVSVHLESHSDARGRAAQMQVLLDGIDNYAPGLPVIIGGDFNTKSADRDTAKDRQALARLLAADPQRLINPVPYEPLFELAASRGYDWRSSNTSAATQRSRPDGTPQPPFGRLDWFFTRGLNASNAATTAAVDKAGQAISDHDLLSVTVESV